MFSEQGGGEVEGEGGCLMSRVGGELQKFSY